MTNPMAKMRNTWIVPVSFSMISLIRPAASAHADRGGHGGVLDEGDEGGPERGDGAAEGLGEDHLGQALSEGEPDRPGLPRPAPQGRC